MRVDETTWVDRFLITSAIFFSAGLALTTALQTHLNGNRRLEYFLVSLTVAGCILSGVAGWVLFVSRVMSLDAFGIILIGLIPGVEAIGKIRIIEDFRYMQHRPSLHNNLKKVKYLRHGEPPIGESQYTATTYLRQPASSKSSKIIGEFGLRPDIWYGQVLSFDDKVIVLRDLNDIGESVRWWKKANEAIDVVRNPSKAHLHQKEDVTRALELIAEISMIGDSIFEYHGPCLRNFAEKSESLKTALSRTPGSVCAAILDAVQLSKEWGPVDEDLRKNFASASEFDQLSRAKQYGMLFFILLEQSNLFELVKENANDKSKLSDAQDVIKCFQKTANRDTRETKIRNWLSRYGLNVAGDGKHCCGTILKCSTTTSENVV